MNRRAMFAVVGGMAVVGIAGLLRGSPRVSRIRSGTPDPFGTAVVVTKEVLGAGAVSRGVALPPVPPVTGSRHAPVKSWGRPLPYPIVIADRRNNRLLEVTPDKRIVWEFPSPDLGIDRGNEDVIFSPDGRLRGVSEEDSYNIHFVDYAKRALTHWNVFDAPEVLMPSGGGFVSSGTDHVTVVGAGMIPVGHSKTEGFSRLQHLVDKAESLKGVAKCQVFEDVLSQNVLQPLVCKGPLPRRAVQKIKFLLTIGADPPIKTRSARADNKLNIGRPSQRSPEIRAALHSVADVSDRLLQPPEYAACAYLVEAAQQGHQKISEIAQGAPQNRRTASAYLAI